MTREIPNKTRDNWVDYCKAIGIVLVVYGHVARGVFSAGLPIDETFFKVTDKIIYSFHMPLFFFVSGLYFYQSFSNRKFKAFTLRKIDYIFYPYALWSIIQGGIEVYLVRYTNSDATFSEIFSLLWEPRAQFWFLYALFLVSIFSAILFSNISANIRNVAILMAASVILYFTSQYYRSVSQFWFIAQYLVFFVIGMLFTSLRIDRVLGSKLVLIVLAGAFVLFHYLIFGILEMSYLNLKAISLFASILGILLTSALALFLAKAPSNWVTILGESSLEIYLLHIMAGSGIRIIMATFFGISSVTVHLVVGFLFGLLFPLIVVKIVRAYRIPYVFNAPISRVFIK